MTNNHLEYYEDLENIKTKNQQKYKEELEREANNLGMLIRNNQIGSAAYDKIASIMNIKPRNIFWKSDEQITKLKLFKGSKHYIKMTVL